MAQRPNNVDEEDWGKLQGELARIGAGQGTGGVPLEKLITAGPEDLGNDANLELLWAEKAFKHAETYFAILRLMPVKAKIKLTQLDDELYARFRTLFPKAKFAVDKLVEDDLKSDASKQAWRVFCNAYDKDARIVDFNMGTLLRLDAKGEYEQDNTTVVPRVQFFAIEIARNREGCNDSITKPAAAAAAKAS
jgi:hypothetical protein